MIPSIVRRASPPCLGAPRTFLLVCRTSRLLARAPLAGALGCRPCRPHISPPYASYDTPSSPSHGSCLPQASRSILASTRVTQRADSERAIHHSYYRFPRSYFTAILSFCFLPCIVYHALYCVYRHLEGLDLYIVLAATNVLK